MPVFCSSQPHRPYCGRLVAGLRKEGSGSGTTGGTGGAATGGGSAGGTMGANTAARGGQEGSAAAVAGGQSLTTEEWRHNHRFHGKVCVVGQQQGLLVDGVGECLSQSKIRSIY
jgi:hypothetical protein